MTMTLAELIQDAALKASRKGHKLAKFKTSTYGAVSVCKACGDHVRVTTAKNGVIFGKAYFDGCNYK